MPRTVVRLQIALLLLACTPIVAAGTEDHPEVWDPPGNVRSVGYVPVGAPLVSEAADLLGAWFHDDQASSFETTVRVVNLSRATKVPDLPSAGFQYSVFFSTNEMGQSWATEAEFSGGIWTYGLVRYDHNNLVNVTSARGFVDYANSSVSVLVDKIDLGVGSNEIARNISALALADYPSVYVGEENSAAAVPGTIFRFSPLDHGARLAETTPNGSNTGHAAPMPPIVNALALVVALVVLWKRRLRFGS